MNDFYRTLTSNLTLTASTPFCFTADPGHGWMIVSRDYLAALGLKQSDISAYSYSNGIVLALEEDCDAATFLNAFKAKFGCDANIVEHFTDYDHPVRTWNRFGTKVSAYA